MDGADNKEVVSYFVEWLRQNRLGNTEQTLLKEFETYVASNSSQPKEVKSTPTASGSDVAKLPPFEEEPQGPSPPKSESTAAKNVESQPQAAKDPEKGNYTSGLSPTQLGPCETDDWTGPEDLGFARIPGQAGDEMTEVIEDEEHRRHLPPYKEQLKPMQLNKGLKKQSTSASAEEEEEDDTAPPPADPEPIEEPQGEESTASKQDDGPAPQSLQEAVKKTNNEEEKPAIKPDGKHHGQPYTQYDTEHGKRSKSQPTVYEAFDLKVIYEVNRTGFEEHKDYPIRMHAIIAGRYQILEYLGSAAFSRAVQCVDLKNGQLVCVKIIRNNKDFFDQGLDEIKLLQYINSAGDANECCVLQLYDYFYHKEHLFLVCELLRDNLYEFSKYNRESGDEPYFTLPRLQRITRQVLTALRFVHRLNLIHCDLKPENILIKSYSRCEVKVIDFGSTCFTTDHLSTYVQSRCYRAPEVLLGLPYTQKIDMWSLGAILAELYTGRVLFHNDSIQTMMARILAICGPMPPHMLRSGRYTNRFFTRHGRLFERNKQAGTINYLQPRRCNLRHRLGAQADDLFVDFVETLLQVDPANRPTAAEALQHPWLHQDIGPIQ